LVLERELQRRAHVRLVLGEARIGPIEQLVQALLGIALLRGLRGAPAPALRRSPRSRELSYRLGRDGARGAAGRHDRRDNNDGQDELSE
jgi:hypothetical protein